MVTPEDYKVVIVDDDFMIVRLHSQYISAQPGFRVVGTATNAADTLSCIQETAPDLMILDVYLPDTSGIEVLNALRAKKIACDVILITAAKELDVVEEAFRLGVVDYLVKPFPIERLGISLRKYAQFRTQLSSSSEIDQDVVDELRNLRNISTAKRPFTESGIDFRTLERIKACLLGSQTPCSAEDVAAMAGLSRSTARVYLDHLVEQGMAREELLYGNVGRPRRLFRLA
jgi:response regulator of citrate/malate metabolism